LHWTLNKILALFPGDNDKVRIVIMKTSYKEFDIVIIRARAPIKN